MINMATTDFIQKSDYRRRKAMAGHGSPYNQIKRLTAKKQSGDSGVGGKLLTGGIKSGRGSQINWQAR